MWALTVLALTANRLSRVTNKCLNIHTYALIFVNFLVLLFCSILFHFCIFCVFVGYGRKGSVSGKVPSLKGKLGRPRRCGKD
jgi:hypothetical protein